MYWGGSFILRGCPSAFKGAFSNPWGMFTAAYPDDAAGVLVLIVLVEGGGRVEDAGQRLQQPSQILLQLCSRLRQPAALHKGLQAAAPIISAAEYVHNHTIQL